MNKLDLDGKIKFLMKLARLQGFVGVSQIEEISQDFGEEKVLTQSLEENFVEINHFLKPIRSYKTVSYRTKKENTFTLTTRTDPRGESFLLSAELEKKLFENLSCARDKMLKFAFRCEDVREFIYGIAKKTENGTVKISSVLKDESSEEYFSEKIAEIQKTADGSKVLDLFMSLNFNEKTKSAIYNKFTNTEEYKNYIENELYNYERVYSNTKREIIEANIRLVFSIAKEYGAVHKGILDISDIIQEGNIGLIDAVESFDVTRGNKFSSWATWYIRRSIWAAVNSCKNTVYIPAKTSGEISKITAYEEKYKMLKGKKPDSLKIAEEFNLTEKQVISLKASEHFDTVSNYEQTVSGGDYQPFDLLLADEIKKNINEMLNTVGERERSIIELYFGLIDGRTPLNLSQIGEIYGLSSERVRQIIAKNIKNMRNSEVGKILEDWDSK